MSTDEKALLPSMAIIRQHFQGKSRLADLEEIVGTKFEDPALLARAVTHRSCRLRIGRKIIVHSNEALEFLGDRVLELSVCNHLHQIYPGETEYFYATILSLTVSNASLGDIAESLGLQEFLVTRSVEVPSRRMLADLMEAIIGALYLDSGLGAVDRFLAKCLFPRISELVTRNLKSVRH